MTSSPGKIIVPDKPLFVLTVDTEEEWDWTGEFPKPPFSTSNIEKIPDFQSFCQQLDIVPTYFVDHAVANNETHSSILKHFFDRDECDVGAHLHPWANPPMDEKINERNSHAINLPLPLFETKMNELTNKLNNVFGRHPYSYRAGRWGVNAQHLKVLHKLGYRVDSSVRPFYRDKYFSYDSAPTRPYWPSSDNALVASKDEVFEILEVPTTSGYNFSNFELLDKIHTKLSTNPVNRLRLVGILWRTGLMRQITVTPEGTKRADLCRCIDASIRRGDKVINMFFHSSDLLPGCTPYVKSEAEKTQFLDVIRHCVDHLRTKHEAQVTTMREIRRQLTGTP